FHSFVDNFTMFIIASTLSGIALGFMIGAPLNVLAGENTEKDRYGSSIGTLSLSRQVGMTIFPTIFASFVTTGVIKIEPTFQAVFGQSVIPFDDGVAEGEGYGVIMEEIAKIEDPYLQNQLLDIVANVMNTGFQQMFISAMVVSVLVLTISGFIHFGKSKNTP
ncbi:MAG TPA: hypothetical protein VK085_01795, partial [Pseudogracilibacillus sp.]|nr:hypothetical protein [Pseudogracilibacillus sp.]